MPMSKAFEGRLYPILRDIVAHFGTPFHIYNEKGILETGKQLKQVFGNVAGFREFFAVKANPNLEILKLMRHLGFGFDCSSRPELMSVRKIGALPSEIMFTSNNTSQRDFEAALAHGGCILNLDDLTLVPKVLKFPELICFRYNPGPRRTGNEIIGDPVKAKYGVSHEQIIEAYHQARKRGAKRFGLHTMVCSNELNYRYMVETVKMLLGVAKMISQALEIRFEFINMGGGLGIPYKSKDVPIPIETMAQEIKQLLDQFEREQHYAPKLYLESGRWVTGPHGVLVASCINQKHIYTEFRGLDGCCLSTMMRPAMYYPEGGYHHISVLEKDGPPFEKVNVVGSACENCDQFGRDRQLPKIEEGDIVLIHDTGAHCYAMASNYNGRLRPKELLFRSDGRVELIRRAETVMDLWSTFQFKPDVF